MNDRPTSSSRLSPADAARIGLTGLRTGCLRAALAVLGIAVGIAALVAVVGVSEYPRPTWSHSLTVSAPTYSPSSQAARSRAPARTTSRGAHQE